MARASELAEALEDDESLPREIRQLLQRRVSDMRWALDQIRIEGAGGVDRAAQLLAMAFVEGVGQLAQPEGAARAREEEQTAAQAEKWKKQYELLSKVQVLVSRANTVISAPGAWWATGALAMEATHYGQQVLQSLGQG